MKKVSVPTVSCLDPRFRYVPSYKMLDPCATELRKTFARERTKIRRAMKRRKAK